MPALREDIYFSEKYPRIYKLDFFIKDIIDKILVNGFYNVKIGFDGYNSVKTKRWPSGQPNAMVARSIESGTSWMTKQPFMRKAEQASKSQCEHVMSETVDIEIKKIIGE